MCQFGSGAEVYPRIKNAPLTNEGIGEFLLVQPVHINRSHIVLGEEVAHDSTRQAEAVVCVDPVVVEDLLSARVWRTNGRGGRTGNGRPGGCGACRDLGLGLGGGDGGRRSGHGREMLLLEVLVDGSIHVWETVFVLMLVVLEMLRRLLLLLLVGHVHGE